MQVVLKGNSEYNNLITQRYSILEKLDSKEVLTSNSRLDLQNDLNDINSRISKINDSESEFNKILINNIRNNSFIKIFTNKLYIYELYDYVEFCINFKLLDIR